MLGPHNLVQKAENMFQRNTIADKQALKDPLKIRLESTVITPVNCANGGSTTSIRHLRVKVGTVIAWPSPGWPEAVGNSMPARVLSSKKRRRRKTDTWARPLAA